MADLLAEFGPLAGSAGGVCAFATLELPDDEREKLDAALAEPRISHQQITRWLKTKGAPVGYSTVRRHRNGGCKCR